MYWMDATSPSTRTQSVTESMFVPSDAIGNTSLFRIVLMDFRSVFPPGASADVISTGVAERSAQADIYLMREGRVKMLLCTQL